MAVGRGFEPLEGLSTLSRLATERVKPGSANPPKSHATQLRDELLERAASVREYVDVMTKVMER